MSRTKLRELPDWMRIEPRDATSNKTPLRNNPRVHQREFNTLIARIETFANWPIGHVQRPFELAQAGFYYLGENDRVCCYCCGGELDHWEPEDDPWVEHARWLGHCRFLVRNVGQDYIKETLAWHRKLNRSSAPSDKVTLNVTMAEQTSTSK